MYFGFYFDRGFARRRRAPATNNEFLYLDVSLSEAATGPVKVNLRYLSGSGQTEVDGYGTHTVRLP